MTLIRAEGLRKAFQGTALGHAGELELFRGLDLQVAEGELIAIVGESGTGKSSLLHLLAALDRPSAGEVWFNETRLGALTSRQSSDFRNRLIGYVWQFHYLLPEFTAQENVAMPLLARGTKRPEALTRATHWLAEVGLAGRAHHRSGELSGDLDERTSESVFALIQRLHRAHGLTSVLVTHNLDFARRCDRMLRLKEGKLVATQTA
jgi:lipoprotein-releasing system ATP-binding protein